MTTTEFDPSIDELAGLKFDRVPALGDAFADREEYRQFYRAKSEGSASADAIAREKWALQWHGSEILQAEFAEASVYIAWKAAEAAGRIPRQFRQNPGGK